MSGIGEVALVLGLVSSTITVFEAALEIYEAASDQTGLPKKLRTVAEQIPLVYHALSLAKQNLEAKNVPAEALQKAKPILAQCNKSATSVKEIFDKTIPTKDASRLDRLRKAGGLKMNSNKVKMYMEEIWKSIELLAQNQVFQDAKTLQEIKTAVEQLATPISPYERPETPPDPSIIIPFARDPDFVERGDLLGQIDQQCAVPGSRTALAGLGGVGKSQLAIEYAYRTRKRSPSTWVFWVHASSAARFEQSYRNIADQVKIFGRKDPRANILKLVRDWLCNGKNGSWLLVLDNVDDTYLFSITEGAGQGVQGTDAQPMSAYLPQSQNGSILITSRNKDIALKLVEEKCIILVNPMAQSHALALLRKKLGPLGDDDDIAKLAAELEYMPLAIAQSAAHICQRRPRYSVQQYLEDFRKSDREKTSLLNYEGGQLRRDWEAKNSIIITWQISFEYIQQNWPSAADLLSLMSFFDRQGIPESLIRNGAQTGGDSGCSRQLDEDKERDRGEESDADAEEDTFEDDIQVLRNYLFVSCDTEQTFEMHALVQLAMRKWLEATEQLEPWKQRFIHSLSVAFPPGKYENWTRCQALFPHVKSAMAQRPIAEGSLSNWVLLMYHAACYAWTKGSIVEAVQLSQAALKVSKEIFGREHENTLSSMEILGLAYSLGGRWKEAEELQMQVMKTRKRKLGEEDPDTLTSMNNLALTYSCQGHWKETEELQMQVMEARKRKLGEEYSCTLISMTNLALTYSHQGHWKEAEELQIQVMKTSKRVLGEEHPSTLISMNNLASTYLCQGHWKEAEELQMQVMKTSKRVLGEEHPDTLISMNNLAFIWKKQGQDTKAIKLMMECVHLRSQILGADHPNTSFSSKALTMWQEGI